MISDRMKSFVAGSSAIRAMFEEGKKMAAIHGAENVYDFSLGNPSVEAPEEIKKAAIEILNNTSPSVLHGYPNNSGFEDVRTALANMENEKHGTNYTHENFVMTAGAAAAMNIILKSILNPGDEVIVFAPFFSEYRAHTSNYDGVTVVISPNTVDFQPNLKEFKEKLNAKTKAVIINTPNNPTGVIYSEETLKELSAILNAKQKEIGHPIYLISDEPYRELFFGDFEIPFVPDFYDNTFIAYSYSKSLSLPGERIGYVEVSSKADGFSDIMASLN
ncbi:MAG: aminotransferase class I/II-fold pyridoxal phosphate-dependent enzyme, partial [Anaerotignaceae bacterium]